MKSVIIQKLPYRKIEHCQCKDHTIVEFSKFQYWVLNFKVWKVYRISDRTHDKIDLKIDLLKQGDAVSYVANYDDNLGKWRATHVEKLKKVVALGFSHYSN